MRAISVSILGVVVGLFTATSAYASCNPNNPFDPENDCDNDGCKIGGVTVLDCNDSPDGGIKQHSVTCTTATPAAIEAAKETCDGIDNNCNGAVDEANANLGTGGACTVPGAQGVCAPGTWKCVLGALKCDANVSASAEVCDGQDNDCDGSTDEQDGNSSQKLVRSCFDGPGTAGMGVCKSGQQACSGNNTWTACGSCGALATCAVQVVASNPPGQAEAGAPLCDGKDNDCDGTVDDGNPGGGASCSTGQPGVCAAGTMTCHGATGLQCDPTTPSSAEVCDGFDNDCDTFTDEQNADSSKKLVTACYNGPGGTRNVGECRDGQASCDAAPGSGTAHYGACSGEVWPVNTPASPETLCDNKDNDCDNTRDDGFNLGMSCTGPGVGRCGTGTLACKTGDPSTTQCNLRTAITETCNNIDDNCDNLVDNGLSVGTPGGGGPCSVSGRQGRCAIGVSTCTAGSPVCNATYDGGISELCNGVDDDCDGTSDNNIPGVGVMCQSAGLGECGPGTQQCQPDGGSLFCRPNQQAQTETCDNKDNDCDGQTDESVSQVCFPGDAGTFVGTCPGPSCNTRGECRTGTQQCTAGTWGTCGGGLVLPVPESCDNKDNDCDGNTDNGLIVDNDRDSSRACGTCNAPMACDCNDNDATIKPGAIELCDNIDQNCSGSLNDVPPRRCFSDANGVIPDPTTYNNTCPGSMCTPKGACAAGTQTCLVQGAWSVCGNGSLGNLVLPTTEVCDGQDNNCDGQVDNASFELDVDHDGFKSCALCASLPNCDCDDTDATIRPGAPEVCDNKDNNCDGTTDGANTACYSGPANTRGLGVCRDGTQVCMAGVGQGACSGEVTPARLSDGGVPFYTDAGVGPNDPEQLCNGVDDDCDGLVDDGFDVDGDGQTVCAGDCNDSDAFNKQNGVEICDCKDNNCNSVIDDSSVCYGAPCHDFDFDGFSNCQGDCDDTPGTGNAINPNRTEVVGDHVDNDCDGAIDEDTDEDGDGYSTSQGDCNDRLRQVNPGALEICDGFDNNCNGKTDEGFDGDGDSVSVCAGDCNDNNPAINPTLLESCGNGKDDNCDGRIDEDTDADGDGVSTCQGDCNDFNLRVHPASGAIAVAQEVCDGQDNNCNGQFDEGFDKDSDNVSSCFGDCNDDDNTVNPYQVEIPGNMKDDNCDGQVDEGTTDRDNDGFTPNCGDCNDSDLTVNPHSKEVCDRIDNNCDGFVDSAKGVYDLCSVCFDADGDGQTNCDGDCNDADKAIYRGASEICDGKDNDCDGMIDLDPATGIKVCRAEDGGTTDFDAGQVDAGPVPGVDAGEGAPVDAGTRKPGVVEVSGCGCSTGSGLVPLALMGLMAARRRRSVARAAKHAVVALALLLMGCHTSLSTPFDDAGNPGSTDGSVVGDGGVTDGGPIIILPNWSCPGLNPVEHLEAALPTTNLAFAYSRVFTTSPNSFTVVEAANALLFDDVGRDVAAAVLVRQLPASVDPSDPSALDDIAAREMAALDALQGSPLVRSRTERFSRVYDDIHISKNFSTSQDLSFATATNAFAVRNRLLANFANKSPAALGSLPPGQSAAAESDMSVSVFFRVAMNQLYVGFAVTPASKFKDNQSMLSDLTNGSHLSGPDGHISYACEHRMTPALKTDFILVMDNTPSTIVWRAALANASTNLFAAFQRSGLDFRIGVVTTDSEVLRGKGFVSNVDDFRAALQVGLAGNTNEMGIEYGLRAVQRARQQTEPALKLRENAGLVVLFMSDEDNHGTSSVADLVAQYKAESAVAFSIVGPRPLGCTKVGYAQALPGAQYITLANQTGGSSGSICNENVSEVIEEIVIGALGVSSRTPLMRRPISASIAVRSGTSLIKRSRSNGFDYEPSNNSVLFFGAAAPRIGGDYDSAYAYFEYIQ